MRYMVVLRGRKTNSIVAMCGPYSLNFATRTANMIDVAIKESGKQDQFFTELHVVEDLVPALLANIRQK